MGQEVIARLDTYDKVQRRLVRRLAAEPVANGSVVRPVERAGSAGSTGTRRQAGVVTTAVPSGDGERWLVLALVPAELAPGAALEVSGGEDEEGAGRSVVLETS